MINLSTNLCHLHAKAHHRQPSQITTSVEKAIRNLTVLPRKPCLYLNPINGGPRSKMYWPCRYPLKGPISLATNRCNALHSSPDRSGSICNVLMSCCLMCFGAAVDACPTGRHVEERMTKNMRVIHHLDIVELDQLYDQLEYLRQINVKDRYINHTSR